ncbi:Nse4-domain-containing protein [Lindgomyces ingoldianus]|uniref:Nse4-domain-containing protein n=1 Tax=Lindgomyces ingoldianus TaxID=673940 RepID=A0ACB6QHT2_9PLEO|nr:Nse4-domain-containing protein [Lindgomyces ingoldianus]KAF2465696.1 Nse4-domain-containing protein [Lindgomyces ingoldianus]
MARLNAHLSATPQSHRSSTVDSLYRDPTPRPHLNSASSRQAATLSAMSPARSLNSDKENQEPDSRANTPRPTKARRPMAASAPRLPTPNSGPGSASGSSSSGANKRRRTGDYTITNPTAISRHGEEDLHDGRDEVSEHHDNDDDDDDGEADGTKYYNPCQDVRLRQAVRANITKNLREMEENRDELIKPGNSGLLDHIKRENGLMEKVRQTSDAVQDARFMVTASDYAGKKMNNCLQGNAGVGVDIDVFVSKCIFFMRAGGRTAEEEDGRASTQERGRTRTAANDDDEDDDSGDGLDWAVLGREACFPFNRRPPTCSFLLGPLSVQKRARTTQARRARSQRQPLGPATKPQELEQSDLKQSENSNLTHLVKGIKSRLEKHIQAGTRNIEAELEELGDEPDDEDFNAACRRQRVYQSPDQEPCVSLFDFVVNPNSFGQTVENLFYVSFLIREGNVKVLQDEHSLPLLVPSAPHSLQEQRERNVQKHQAVFSIDWPTWKKLIEAFDIKEPLIPHRVAEETNVSAGAWYG